MEDVVNEHKSQQDKLELLYWASARGLYADVVALVSEGADPGCKDKQGRTPSHFAAAHGHAAVLEYLSTKGVDVDAEDKAGRAPLHYAALGNHADAVKVLCQKGAWVDGPDGQDDTPLHLAVRGLNPGVDQGGAKPTEAPSTTDPTATNGLNQPQDKGGRSSLAGAAPVSPARRDYTAAVRALVEAGAKLDLRNGRGLTPLGEAVVWNNPAAVALLIDKKALATVTAKGYTLLHLAAGLGHTECLERLIVEGRRPPTDTTDCPDGITPLHAAAQQGRLAAAKLLVERGADVSVLDDQGRFAYELVPASNGSTDVSRTLPTAADLSQLRTLLESGVKHKSKKPPAAVASTATTSTATDQQGDAVQGAAGVVQGVQGLSKVQELSPRDAFRAMSSEEQARKVTSLAKLSDAELKALSFPASSAFPALQALRKAISVHTCWEAVAAVRQDTSFQEDASDPFIKTAIEDLRKPGVDPSKYAKEPQVQAVFAKLNKLYGILRAHGQGFKVTLDDLLVKRTGPSSVADTLRQLQVLESKVAEATQAAIAAVAELPPPATQQQSQAADSGAAATDVDDGSSSNSAGGGDESKKRSADNGLRFRKVTGDNQGEGGVQSVLESNQPLETVEEGQEGPATAGQKVMGVLQHLLWHVFRGLLSVCVMLSVMWMMGLLPDQVLDKQAAAREALSNTLHQQQLSAVDRPAGAGEAAGGTQACGGCQARMRGGVSESADK